MLKGTNLSCERQERLLFENVSFELSPGEVLQIEGPNGSGKTTMLRILCGLYVDFEGEVEWDLDRFPMYLGHRTGVKDHMTAEENLAWLARLHQGGSVDMAEVHGALEQVGLRGFEDIRCGSLSEGQRKRVNIARLYLIRSRAWVLDEPFSAIDTSGVERLHRQIEWQCEQGGSVVLTSHQPVELNCPVRQVSLGAKK
ncbi:MAG: cytochrome c biogenesis heme-transporting ATPase CcmA [Pseudomonadales bacterium]|nr:cytochrome c biogenesis heme-transporting ATPase CcmA [Pseudomonadales bacterium]